MDRFQNNEEERREYQRSWGIDDEKLKELEKMSNNNISLIDKVLIKLGLR